MSQAARTPAERLAQLRQNLADYFSDSELRDVCFDLGVDYDGLVGQNKADKARELIAYLDRRGRVEELIQLCSRLRPRVKWDDALPLTGQASDISASSPLEQRHPGQVVSVTISGNVSGQVAVGKDIIQTQTIRGTPSAEPEAKGEAEQNQAAADREQEKD